MAYIEGRGRWEQLDSPPGEILRLITADDNYVLVETAAVNSYKIYCRTREKFDNCIQQVETPNRQSPLPCNPADIPTPSSQVKDRLMTCFEYEYMIRTQYLIRQDGTLWRWSLSIYPYGQLARFIQILAGSIIFGLVSGFTVLAIRHS